MGLMVKDLMSDLEMGNREEEIMKERSKNPFVPVNQFINPFQGSIMETAAEAQPIQWGNTLGTSGKLGNFSYLGVGGGIL